LGHFIVMTQIVEGEGPQCTQTSSTDGSISVASKTHLSIVDRQFYICERIQVDIYKAHIVYKRKKIDREINTRDHARL
jgi:hypothetical protein